MYHLANKHYTKKKNQEEEPRSRSSLEVKTRAIVSYSNGISLIRFSDRQLLEKIRDRDPRIRSSRAMSDARASSSAMSLDAASELSRTDKRPPTYPPPPRRYFSSTRSGRYPPHVQTHSPCADTRASRKLDNLRASS